MKLTSLLTCCYTEGVNLFVYLSIFIAVFMGKVIYNTSMYIFRSQAVCDRE